MDGAEAMVVGTIARAGNLYLTNLKVVDPTANQTIKTVTARGKGVESLIATQVDELSREIALGAGLSRGKAGEGAMPIASITTQSLEAYRWINQCYARMMKTDSLRVASLTKIIELDKPTFPNYWLHLLRAEIFLASDSVDQAVQEFSKTADTLRLVMPHPVEMETHIWYNLPFQHDVIARAGV